MAIVCSICGGTHVRCAAVIDPNTKEFIEFGYNALSDGQCGQCGNVILTDPDQVKSDIDRIWTEYISTHRAVPNFVLCEIVRTGDYDGCEQAYIRIGGLENVVGGPETVAVCQDINALKALAVPDPDSDRGFTFVECQRFEFQKVLENRTYWIEIAGEDVSVNTKEVMELFPKQYDLTLNKIGRHAAIYTARIKIYRQCDRWLDAALIHRLLDEERLMKSCESDSFKLKLHCQWYVQLRKEEERLYAPFKYAVDAYCLDIVRTFSRRYTSLEQALRTV